MTPKQVDACTAGMPPADAMRFVALHEEATALMQRAWAKRREAWAIYRPYRKERRK